MTVEKTRHILSISGGKDSAALAIYMRDRVPDMEYVFCDTDKELPETYEYLGRLEALLGKRINVLKDSTGGFDHWLQIYGNYLPSPRMRWCTKQLKLHPFESYVGENPVIQYVGIRADEEREGYVSTKPNIQSKFPFKEDGLCYSDIIRVLNDSGIGLPTYYKWRSRSGCYFCFFQQKIEWVGLLENHPNLFMLATKYEKTDETTGKRFTWNDRESLLELSQPERVAKIKLDFKNRKLRNTNDNRLFDMFEDDDCGPQPCLICTL
jgi:hypothetical protein